MKFNSKKQKEEILKRMLAEQQDYFRKCQKIREKINKLKANK